MLKNYIKLWVDHEYDLIFFMDEIIVIKKTIKKTIFCFHLQQPASFVAKKSIDKHFKKNNITT